MKLSIEEEILYAAYGLGKKKAEKVVENIGLGRPILAMALGFQMGVKFFLDHKILSPAHTKQLIEDELKKITQESVEKI